MLWVKAKELSTDPEFKASLGWYSNWKRRQSISMRTKTSPAKRLPADMENKVVEFHRFILRSCQRWGYDLSCILNLDETPMRFELPATRTLEFTGSRTVPVLSCGADKRTAKNCHRKSSPKVFDSWRSTRHLQDASFSAQERLDGRKRYVLSPHCLIRETTFHASDKRDYRNSLERSYYCHRYQVTKHVLLSTYANFRLFAFLLKLFSVLKVSKSTILFQ